MKTQLASAFLCISLLAISVPAGAKPDEELAPGYNQCQERADSTDAQVECINNAYAHWDKILQKNYREALKSCASDENPLQNPQECKTRVKNAMKAWLQYKEAMPSAMYAIGSGGTMDRLIIGEFMLRALRNQAKAMDQNNY